MGWTYFIFPAIYTSLGFWSATFTYGALFVMLWAVFRSILELRCGDKLCDVQCGTWGLKLAMFCHHVLAAPLAVMAILEDATIVRLFTCFGCPDVAPIMIRDPSGPSGSAQALIPLTMGYMVADLVLLNQWQLSAKGSNMESMLMVAHHFFSLLVWPMTLYYDFCSRYVLIMVAYELSSIFLTLNWMLSTSGYKESLWYKISGALFTLTFVVVRLLGALPQLRALAIKPPWNCYSEYPEGGPILIKFSFTLLFPHLLNFAWGVKVIRGFFTMALASKSATSLLQSNSDSSDSM